MRALTLRLFIFSVVLSQSLLGMGQVASATRNDFPLYIKVQLDKSVKLSSLRPGDVTEGNLTRDVYSADRKIFSAGSHVRLTVDHLERQRRVANDHWPWIVRLLTPRYQKFPSFKDAAISAPDGTDSRLQVSVISASARTEVHAQHRQRHRKKEDAAGLVASSEGSSRPAINRPQSSRGPVMSLGARQESDATDAYDTQAILSHPMGPVTLPAGTPCKTLLIKGVSASKSRAGDAIQARLLEPVIVNSDVVLPAGSLFEGNVVKATHPRWLSRAGSLSVTFTRVTFAEGTQIPVAASLTGVEVDRRSHTKIDAEGRLHGDHPGMAWTLINSGVTAGLSKEVDDGTQLIIEAILSSATDASTAGTARLVGAAVSGVFMITRHGRDVVLPNFTELEITLNRPLRLDTQSVQSPTPNR